jgi:hypothetical protein
MSSFAVTFLEYLTNRYRGSPNIIFCPVQESTETGCSGKVFVKSPAMDVMNSRTNDSLVKDVLTVEELQTLAMTYCGNEEVKRLSCLVVKPAYDSLTLSSKMEKRKKWDINRRSAKNGTRRYHQLNKTALKLLGESGSG